MPPSLLSPDFTVHDAEYDTLLQTLPSKIVSNIIGVFGSTNSGKSSFINELIRVKAIQQNNLFATGGFNGSLLTPDFVFSKTGRIVNYDTIIPSIRIVKPLPACSFERLLLDAGIVTGHTALFSVAIPESNPYSEKYQRSQQLNNGTAAPPPSSSLGQPLMIDPSLAGALTNTTTTPQTQRQQSSASEARAFGLPRDPLDNSSAPSTVAGQDSKASSSSSDTGGVTFSSSPNAHVTRSLFGGPPLLVITKATDAENGYDAKAVDEQQRQWKSKLDQICAVPIANPPAETDVASHIVHTVCLDVFERTSKLKKDAHIITLNTIFGKCDSVLGTHAFHRLAVSAGVGGVLDDSILGGEGDAVVKKGSKTPSPSHTRQPIPTSITLVNASVALQEMHSTTLDASRTNNLPGVSHMTIGRISKEKHRLISSAIVEFTFGNKDPFSLLPPQGGRNNNNSSSGTSSGQSTGNKPNILSRLFSRTRKVEGSNADVASTESIATEGPTTDHYTFVVASDNSDVLSTQPSTSTGGESLKKSTRNSPINVDSIHAASSVIRSVDKLLYCLPVNQHPAEEAAATFFKIAFQVAVEGKFSSVLDPALNALLPNGVATPDERILQVQTVMTKLDVFCSVHRHGVDLALVTAKKAASALYERFIVPTLSPLSADHQPETTTTTRSQSLAATKQRVQSDDDGEDDTSRNKLSVPSSSSQDGGDNKGGVRPRTAAFHPARLPKPIVVACDGYNGFLPDSSRELDRAPVFLGNRKKYEILPDVVYDKIETHNLCDWLVFTKLNLLKSRGGRRNNTSSSGGDNPQQHATTPSFSNTPPPSSASRHQGTIPTIFAEDSTVEATASRLRALGTPSSSSTTAGDQEGAVLEEQLINLMGQSLRCTSF